MNGHFKVFQLDFNVYFSGKDWTTVTERNVYNLFIKSNLFMKQKKARSNRQSLICLLICSLMGFFSTSCQDDKKNSEVYDPSQPVIFTEFTPTEGALRTRLYIYGSNFGNDVSKIHVSIGGQSAKVIGANGNAIHCMVPRRAFNGDVNIKIENEQGEMVIDYTFEQKFSYQSKIMVSTLCGKVDELGHSAMKDGSFKDAEFTKPYWLALDKYGDEKALYLTEQELALRKISLDNEDVSTVVTNGQGGFFRMQGLTFHPDGDTLFIADDNGRGDKGMMAVAYLLRSRHFNTANPYVYDRCSYSCAIHPTAKGLYYNTYFKAAIMKARAQFNEQSQQWESKQLFNVIENDREGWSSSLVFHPEGKYLYIVGLESLLRSDYNNGELQPPYKVAGELFSGGYADGMGSNARFSSPSQGVFVKNEDYVNAGKDDVYDFYLCDTGNHCIRKITPEGAVSTYAGRGTASADGKVDGYIDGDLRTEARFLEPTGIAYDEDNGTFYIADRGNKRIRFIAIE